MAKGIRHCNPLSCNQNIKTYHSKIEEAKVLIIMYLHYRSHLRFQQQNIVVAKRCCSVCFGLPNSTARRISNAMRQASTASGTSLAVGIPWQQFVSLDSLEMMVNKIEHG